MSCSCAGDLANIYAAIGNLEGQFNYITGNTMSNYNQLSRIVAQQSNIYNTVYYGLGNLATGNLTVNNSYVINGNLTLPTGNLLISSGNILSTVGNLVMSNGNISVTNGNLIVNNGNIGIWTSVPKANLDVQGNAIINGNLSIGNGNLFMNRFGNLGLNTTNPLATLEINGNARISGNVTMGPDVSSTIQNGTVLVVRNISQIDSNITGSISGNVYNQFTMAGRNWTFSQDVSNDSYLYFGVQGGGAPDPDFEYFFKRNVGLQIQPNPSIITTDFNSALSVLGNAVITNGLNVTSDIIMNGNIFQNAKQKTLPVLDAGFVTASGSYTIPSNVFRVKIIAIGGGGGGSNTTAGGSGGGGGAGSITYLDVTPGTTMTISIGVGGGQQTQGGTTTVTYNSVIVCSAVGGFGADTSVSTYAGAGGPRTGVGDIRVTGQSGTAGSTGTTFAGAGGSSAFGFGGGGRGATATAGSNGLLYGGGGSSYYSGANGCVMIEY